MINTLLGIVAPHHCYGCQKTGTLLCDNCKYNIENEPFGRCIRCLGLSGVSGICERCADAPYSQVWCIGERRDVVEQLIDGYKFYNALDAARMLGTIMADTLPDIPPDACFVPIPTIATHVRQRGYDHTREIVRVLRRRCGCRSEYVLRRKTQTVQRGASRVKRLQQAKQAFRVDTNTQINPTVPYILVDDVYTTGATIDAAAHLLREAGAEIIWVAIGAREPLDS